MYVWYQLLGGGAPAGGYGDVTLDPGAATLKGFTLSLVMNICARYQLQGQTITTQCQTEWSPALAGQQTTVAVSQLGVSLPPPHNFTAGWHPIFSVHDKYLGEKVTLDIMEGVSSESPRISQTFGQSIKSAFSSHFAEG